MPSHINLISSTSQFDPNNIQLFFLLRFQSFQLSSLQLAMVPSTSCNMHTLNATGDTESGAQSVQAQNAKPDGQQTKKGDGVD